MIGFSVSPDNFSILVACNYLGHPVFSDPRCEDDELIVFETPDRCLKGIGIFDTGIQHDWLVTPAVPGCFISLRLPSFISLRIRDLFGPGDRVIHRYAA